MKITDYHRHFLCLHRLSGADLQTFETNLARFAHFRVSDSAILICTDSTENEVMVGIGKDVPAGSINLLWLKDAQLVGLSDGRQTSPFGILSPDWKTVYEEPKTGA